MDFYLCACSYIIKINYLVENNMFYYMKKKISQSRNIIDWNQFLKRNKKKSEYTIECLAEIYISFTCLWCGWIL